MERDSNIYNPKWYVLKIITGQEKKVKAYIEAEFLRAGIDSQEVQVLIPAEKVFEVRSGKRSIKEKLLYPGYVLVYADLKVGSAAHIIVTVPGVLGFLSARGWGISKDPMPLRESEINNILGRVEELSESVENIEKKFVVGESIKVIDGPFSGFIGSVQEILEDRKKLKVTVKVFGRNTPVELGYVQVEKIAS